jgi:hypothetical protein
VRPRPDVSYQVSGTSGLQILKTNSTDNWALVIQKVVVELSNGVGHLLEALGQTMLGLTPNNLVLGITLGTVTVVTT